MRTPIDDALPARTPVTPCGRAPGDAYLSVELDPCGPTLVTRSLSAVLAPDAIAIRPLLVGICSADLKEVAGQRPTRADFGHEIVGTIVSAPAATRLLHDDLVAFNPNVPVTRTSGFAQYMVARGGPAALATAFPKLPRGVPLTRLVFCEPLACAHHCVSTMLERCGHRRSGAGLRVAVVGAGTFGTLIALVATSSGASVTLFNRRRPRLDMLRRRQVLPASRLRPLPASTEAVFDVVIPATSFLSPAVLQCALPLVRSGGLMLLFGGTAAGDRLPGGDLDIDAVRRHEHVVRVTASGRPVWIGGSYGANEGDFTAASDLLARDPATIPVERLVSRLVHLAEVPAILRSMTDGSREHVGKVIVEVF